jgi:hypothetical protein
VGSRLVAGVTALLLATTLAACNGAGDGGSDGGGGDDGGGGGGPFSLGGGVDTDPPRSGVCRELDPKAIKAASDDTDPVECSEKHNAETFYVGELADADDVEYDDPSVAAQVYRQCHPRYLKFVGATESLALRTVVDWAWWRPDEDAWDEGARWFRCDVVGGREGSTKLVDLPESAKGMLLGIPPPRWMLCANGAQVADAPKVPCSQPHTWRAVSAVVLGKKKDKWPGGRVVEVNTRDYCSDWVGAWLNYPVDYEYGYTWFGEAEWRAGNRQSVCWAQTDE